MWWEGGKDLLCTDFPALALSLVAPPSPLFGGAEANLQVLVPKAV